MRTSASPCLLHRDLRCACWLMQAAMSRKPPDNATQWTLTYQLNSSLRMQFNIASSSPYPRTLIFQYSGESVPQ